MKREELMSIKDSGNLTQKARKLYYFILDNSEFTDYLENLATVKDVCNSIVREAEQNNLASIGISIQGITEWNAEYFKVDGYGNYSDLTNSTMDDLIEDMMNQLDGEGEQDE